MQRLGRGLRILENDPEFQIAPRERKVRTQGGGGGGNIVATITDVSEVTGLGLISQDCGYVEAVVQYASCGLSGVSTGDTVKVWDGSLCWFNITIDLLVGLKVLAVLMKRPDSGSSVDCATAMAYEDNCIWVAQGLCCAEEYA